MAKQKRYTTRKYDGDDLYSWAVFRTEDVRGIRGVVFYGDASPVMSGLDQYSARWEAKRLNERS